MTEKNRKSEQEGHKELTQEQFHICREKGTEQPFTGKYWNSHEPGIYRCICCNNQLFAAKDKFDSGTGWPSYTKPISKNSLDEEIDNAHGMRRTEVICKHCGAHLGHVFPDGPAPTGLRYCINSAALILEKK